MAAVMASGGSVGINVLRYSGIAENHHTSGKGRGLLPSSPMQTFSQPDDQEALDADTLKPPRRLPRTSPKSGCSGAGDTGRMAVELWNELVFIVD
jgi:hypothetical protein